MAVGDEEEDANEEEVVTRSVHIPSPSLLVHSSDLNTPVLLKSNATLRSSAREEDGEAQKSFKFTEKNFAPLYFTRICPSDRR